MLSQRDASTLWGVGRALAVTILPWFLVFIQPDLGTSLVFGAITLGMLYWANCNLGWLLLLLSPFGVCHSVSPDSGPSGWCGVA